MLVEMGPDRLHHGFWRFYDRTTPTTCRATRYEAAFRDYYRYLDSEIGALIEGLGDDTACSSSPTTAPRRCSAASRSTSG